MDLRVHAEELLARNRYVTLGTVTPEGRPWTSPVYFAADGLTSFYWCSTLDSRHSVNLAGNDAVSLVVFDSTVAPYTGRALYAEGSASVLHGADLERGLSVYPPPTSGWSARGSGERPASRTAGATTTAPGSPRRRAPERDTPGLRRESLGDSRASRAATRPGRDMSLSATHDTVRPGTRRSDPLLGPT